MKVTSEMVRAAKALLGIRSRRVLEYGMRRSVAGPNTYTGNALIWNPEADLDDTFILSPGETILGDESRGGMVLLDVYVYAVIGNYADMSLSGNVWFLFDELGNILAHDNDHGRVMQAAERHQYAEIAKAERRKLWTETAAKWRALSGMPYVKNGRKRAPLGIVADWAQDHDDEAAAELLREAERAGWPV